MKMSKSLSSVASVEFDSEVKQAYQGMSNLKSTVTQRSNVVGDTYNFRKMGKGLANQKASQADVTPMDVSNEKIPATLGNWNAPEYTDIFDQAEVNFDEQTELAQAIAKALGRREDQLIIDAAVAATANPLIPDSGADLTVTKLRATSKVLTDQGVPEGNRHILVSADGRESLLEDTEVTSSDFNTVKALVNGDIDTYMGFKFHVIETRLEGGLPKTGNIRTNVAYHMEAIGIATGIGPRTEVNYIAQKTSWLANGLLKAGAVARDEDGVQVLANDES